MTTYASRGLEQRFSGRGIAIHVVLGLGAERVQFRALHAVKANSLKRWVVYLWTTAVCVSRASTLTLKDHRHARDALRATSATRQSLTVRLHVNLATIQKSYLTRIINTLGTIARLVPSVNLLQAWATASANSVLRGVTATSLALSNPSLATLARDRLMSKEKKSTL